MPRETGYYWIRDDRERWVVALWNGVSWLARISGQPVGGVIEIGSRIPDEQIPTHWRSAISTAAEPQVKTAGAVLV